jgi:hypothetical protein
MTLFCATRLNYTGWICQSEVWCYQAEYKWLIFPFSITMFDVARLNYKQNFLFPKSFKLGTMPENCSLKQSLSKKQRNNCVELKFAGKSNPFCKTFWTKLQRMILVGGFICDIVSYRINSQAFFFKVLRMVDIKGGKAKTFLAYVLFLPFLSSYSF